MAVSNTNTPQISTRYEQWLEARADGNMREALEEFTLALQSGSIVIPAAQTSTPVHAGGVNYCPNSDFKFSKMAATVPGTTPGTAGDTNQECWKMYRQEQGNGVTIDAAHTLKAVGHSLYAANEGTDATIPIWDRVIGQLVWGAADKPLWDVAIQLFNNDVKPADRWFVRFVIGSLTDDLVPDDLEMFCGFWHKTASTEDWITGGNFNLSYIIPPDSTPGTRELNYVAVARTDGGVTLYSQTLNVLDAPDVMSAADPVRLNYGSASGSGFLEFKIYREDVATGEVHQIAFLRNVNEVIFDDDGDNLMAVPSLPTSSALNTQAIAYSRRLEVGTNGGELLINDFQVQIPHDYDWSQTLPLSQFFRFGFTTETAVNRQIRIDRIYLGPSFNNWSDSPLDPPGATASTSQTGGTPIGGGNDGPPIVGTGGCIRRDVPVLRLDFDRQYEWLPYAQVPHGDLIENGATEKNVVRDKLPVRVRFSYRVDFSNGVWTYCTRPHRFRINAAGDTEAAIRMDVGDVVWGWTKGVEGPVTITAKLLIKSPEDEDFGTFALAGERSDGDHWYIAGFSADEDSGVFNSNSKIEPPVGD